MQLIMSDRTFDNQPILARSDDEYEALLNTNHLLCHGLLSNEEMEAALITWVKLLYGTTASFPSDAILPYFIDVSLDTPAYAEITNEDMLAKIMQSNRLSEKAKDIIDAIVLEYDMKSM